MMMSPFAHSKGINFRGTGTHFVADPSVVTNFDFEVPFDSLINGLEVIGNYNQGDHVSISVVDAQNLLGYGTGTVLDLFANEWRLGEKGTQVALDYAARLKAGFVIRFAFNNSTAVEKRVDMNIFLHKTSHPLDLSK